MIINEFNSPKNLFKAKKRMLNAANIYHDRFQNLHQKEKNIVTYYIFSHCPYPT